MKEARQVFRDTRRWKYKVRSRYIVKPDLVDSLMVHWVHSTKGRAREVVVPQSAAVLAHFRQQLPDGIQLAGPEIKIANNFVPKEIANLTCTWKSWWLRLWKRCKGFANIFKIVTLSTWQITRSEMWQIYQMIGSDDQ